MNTRKIGSDGEKKAVDYLLNCGYSIIEQNIHFGKIGEIDIVAADKDGTIVFVEVKYNRVKKSAYGVPEFRVSSSKMKQLTKLAKIYIYNKKLYNRAVRIDVVAIEGDEIRHFKNCSVF